ncbi:MAG: hydantoinase/oxoprolinase family protein [Methylacidiphilales bacterium]|nr:hydantoinase/oxoprolinase family protein [Candidatus Methylacidiphilales bacterium]
MAYRLGVDVGGTFTDLLLINDDTGQTWTAKLPSTPSDSSLGVLQGIAQICETSGVSPKEITRVMHGTTVATNAVLTGKGSVVGLITTSGYRHTLQVARSFCPGGLGGWASYIRKPLLAPLEHTFEVSERIDASGKILIKLNTKELTSILNTMKKQGGIQALTICFINSYINPSHEKEAKKIAEKILKNIPVSISSEVVPEMQEYERTETTVINSYVRPEVEKYVHNLQTNISKSLGESSQLAILRSDGGLATARAAQVSPVNLLMSGPAGGVAGALYFCNAAGFKNVLTFDMGGTSTDVALIQNGEAKQRRETRVGDVVVRAPSVDVRSVGAGGGSVAYVANITNALRVGPESAGASPGPAAYNKGGIKATVTDANVVLGYLPANVLLGGKMKIDKELAKKAVQEIATPLGISLMDAADGIIRIVNESMFGALRLVSIEQGYDPRDFALVGFGGAGPLHSNALSILLNSWPSIVPPGPGVLCAYGDATTAVQDEASKSVVSSMDAMELSFLLKELDILEKKVSHSLEQDGIPANNQILEYHADIRYAGQAFEITLPFNRKALEQEGIKHLTGRFNLEHEQLFTFSLPHGHELVMIRVKAMAKRTKTPIYQIGKRGNKLSDALMSESPAWFAGKEVATKLYNRNLLDVGHRIEGPAIIIEMDSTTVIHPGFNAQVDSVGNLLINPNK